MNKEYVNSKIRVYREVLQAQINALQNHVTALEHRVKPEPISENDALVARLVDYFRIQDLGVLERIIKGKDNIIKRCHEQFQQLYDKSGTDTYEELLKLVEEGACTNAELKQALDTAQEQRAYISQLESQLRAKEDLHKKMQIVIDTLTQIKVNKL